MSSASGSTSFCRFLKYWRNLSGLSQEELANRIGCSNRHYQRIESGAVHPTIELINQIIRELKLGVRDGNHLRTSAGYAAFRQNMDLDDPQFRWLRKAMIRTLKSLDPHPTMLNDIRGDIRMVNRGWIDYFSSLMTTEELLGIKTLFDIILSRAGPDSENAISLVLMAHQQYALFSGDPSAEESVQRLSRHERVPENWEKIAMGLDPRASFWISLEFKTGIQRFLSVTSLVGGSGPTFYTSEPFLMLNVLYPENHVVSLDQQCTKDLHHPLLKY